MAREWLEFVEDVPQKYRYTDEGCNLFCSCLDSLSPVACWIYPPVNNLWSSNGGILKLSASSPPVLP